MLTKIAVSLQHSDVDVLFFGHKVQLVGELLSYLLQLPLLENEDPSGDEEEKPHRRRAGKHHKRRDSAADDFMPLRKTRVAEDTPLFLRFRAIELQSWLWSVLGFLPFRRVRHRGDVSIVRFTKCSSVDSWSRSDTKRSVFSDYWCAFQVACPHVDFLFCRDGLP